MHVFILIVQVCFKLLSVDGVIPLELEFAVRCVCLFCFVLCVVVVVFRRGSDLYSNCVD